MEAWGELWGGAVALAGILGVVGAIVAALIRLHKLANRFEAVEKMAVENAEQIKANSERDMATTASMQRMESAISMVLRTDIYNLCKEALQKNYCSQDRRKLIKDANAEYKATGGNGDVKDIIKRTYALPLDKETEESL